MHPLYKDDCRKALDQLLDFFAGNKSQLAKTTGVTRNTVSYWFTKGYIGRRSAMAIDANPGIPFSKEALRPDIKHWDGYLVQ